MKHLSLRLRAVKIVLFVLAACAAPLTGLAQEAGATADYLQINTTQRSQAESG